MLYFYQMASICRLFEVQDHAFKIVFSKFAVVFVHVKNEMSPGAVIGACCCKFSHTSDILTPFSNCHLFSCIYTSF